MKRPRHRRARERAFGWLALAAVASVASGCGGGGGSGGGGSGAAAAPFLYRMQFAQPVNGESGAGRDAAPIDVLGDVRRSFPLAAGEELAIPLPELAEPAWLDVAVAALPPTDETAVRAQPPPTPRLIVTRTIAGATTTLFDGLPSPGRPPAFGWGEARIELKTALSVQSELRFRAEAAAPWTRFALAVPRVAPRAIAADRAAAVIEWHATLTEALPSDEVVASWLHVDGTMVRTAAVADEPPLPAGHPAARLLAPDPWRELIAFGDVAPFDPLLALRDRHLALDPYGDLASDPVAQALAERGFAPASIAERRRLLGEHLLFSEIARPRHAPLSIALATLVDAKQAQAALERLVAHLSANELADRVVLQVVLTERRSGGAPRAWWRWPIVFAGGAAVAGQGVDGR